MREKYEMWIFFMGTIRTELKRQICQYLWNRISFPPGEAEWLKAIKESHLSLSKWTELRKAIAIICGFSKKPCNSDMEHKWPICICCCSFPYIDTISSVNPSRSIPLSCSDCSAFLFSQEFFPVILGWLWELQSLSNIPLSGGYRFGVITI